MSVNTAFQGIKLHKSRIGLYLAIAAIIRIIVVIIGQEWDAQAGLSGVRYTDVDYDVS